MTTKQWLPYSALLQKLGFHKTGTNTWKDKSSHPVKIIHWYKLEKDVTLTLAETWSEVFVGEVQSEEEFMVLLRQVRWITN